MLSMAVVEEGRYSIEDMIGFDQLRNAVGMVEVVMNGKTLKLNSRIGERLVDIIKRTEDMLFGYWIYDISLSRSGLVTRITYTLIRQW